MNRREQAILSLFYEEGHQEITPAFLAYRMRMRSTEAADVLDGMVRDGILDIHLGDEGYISYQLPPSERYRFPSHRPPTPASSSTPPTPSGSPAGADASPGYGPQAASPMRPVDDGTDGSVWGSAFVSPVHSRPSPGPAATTAQATAAPTTPQPQWAQPTSPADHPLMTRADQPITRANAETRERLPILAAALSLLFPGLGQFYNGEFGKGILLLFSSAFLLFFYLFWIVWVWSVIDAYMVAEYRNQLSREADETLPRGYLPDR